MANQQQLDLLKQEVEIWNQWRREHPDIQPDLSGAELSGANLSGADLRGSYLSFSNLEGADLSGAYLNHSELYRANLTSVNLSGAELYRTNFNTTNLTSANLSGAGLARTIFADIDLREVNGLEKVKHDAPSSIGIDTLIRSRGDIPVAFLRGAGVTDGLIEYARSLVGQAIDYYTCFISYANQDQPFAERLYNDLQGKGVRCWLAPEHMKTGDRIRDRIDESIRLYDKLLLVLSEHSVESRWVAFEVEAALDKEGKENPLVLFPVRLDVAVLSSPTSWATHIRRTRYISDFTKWKQHDDYQKALNRLLRDLKTDSQE